MHTRSLRLTRLFGICVLSVAFSPAGDRDVLAVTVPRAERSGLDPLSTLTRPLPSGARRLPQSPYSRFEGKISPLEDRLFADAADGYWDDFSLLGAALVASGVEDAERLASYEDRVASLAGRMKQIGAAAGTPRQRAQAVFEFMHRRVLTGGYQLDSTDLRLALDEGRYNCVSASVLFNCLASYVGLNSRGLEIPGHAMSRLVLDEETLDVETTCPGWFRLADDPGKRAGAAENALGRAPAGGGAPARREVTPVELVATIYYNRGVDLLGEGRFADALAANAKALRLDPASATARGNLLATLNNWAIALGGDGRYAEAVERLEEGMSLDPSYALFHANYAHVHRQWIEHLCDQKQFDKALRIAASADLRRPEGSSLEHARLEIYSRWARDCLDAGKVDAAFALFDRAQSDGIGRGEVLDLEAAEVSHRVLTLVGQKQFEAAVTLIDRALARHPESDLLRANRRAVIIRRAEAAI